MAFSASRPIFNFAISTQVASTQSTSIGFSTTRSLSRYISNSSLYNHDKSKSIDHLDNNQKQPNKLTNITAGSTNFIIVKNLSHTTVHKMSTTKFIYPEVERDENCVENKFGLVVHDPYRYLEDPDSEKTKEFVKKQNEVTEPYLNKCPHRANIKRVLTKNQDYKKIGCTFKRGKRYYHYMNEGLQPQSVLYQQSSIDGEARVFLDPNKLSDDGTISVSQTSFSHDGNYMAYATSQSGSDWVQIKIKNVETGEDFPETLTKTKFTGLQWTHDNKGFFYAQYPDLQGEAEGTQTAKLENHTVYYHLVNTPQSDDIVKVSFAEHKDWTISFEVSHDGKYFFVSPSNVCTVNALYYCKLEDFKFNESFKLIAIREEMDSEIGYISNNGQDVYLITNLESKNYRVVRVNLSDASSEKWVDIVPGHELDVLEQAEMFTVNGQDYLLLIYLRKVANYLELHKLGGGLVKKFKTPLGTIAKYSSDRYDKEFFYQFTSFLTPGQTYHFDLTDLNSEPRLLRQSVPKDFNADEFHTEQVFYKSKDGTEVPMFIVYRKDMVKDGNNPCILYGYGGFNVVISPSFGVNRLFWLKKFKGVLAIANIRGGGELGQAWHNGGRLLKKQNCFDDFASAAEYLIEQKYTKRDKLAIEGGSNGGLLVAATANRRPDLFGATLCHVGVLDMVRYATFTIGHLWKSDFGDPENETDFKYLFQYSPYHNIPAPVDRYPATLLLTADHDDRVVPAHSLKFIAQLQHKLGKLLPQTPLLVRVDTKAGHGGGKPIAKIIDEEADKYSFLYNALNLEEYYEE